ncbi:MAG: YdeI/OmpD-associated family protein, partial [Sediminibacterium sp.]|nr:YdeI/OmpD-associated family protein [Sediminibacterium sp.]
RLQFKEEKNLLIQGLPSSMEKQFLKLSFAKDITPLLKSRKIDFALVFVISQNQLNKLFLEILPCLKENSNFWIGFPKNSSKIITDLNFEHSWGIVLQNDFEIFKMIDLDNVWGAKKMVPKHLIEAYRIKEESERFVAPALSYKIPIPFDLEKLFDRNEISKEFFCSLGENEQKTYVDWIFKARKKSTQEKRIITILEKLRQNKRNPY